MNLKRDLVSHNKLYLEIPVPPAPRPRVTRKGISYYPKVYNDFKKRGAFELKLQWQDKEPINKPIEIDIFFLCKKPKSKIRKTTANHRKPRYRARGDLDNLIKSVLDILQDSAVIENDSLIYSIKAEAWYAGVQEEPLTTIKINEVIKASYVP